MFTVVLLHILVTFRYKVQPTVATEFGYFWLRLVVKISSASPTHVHLLVLVPAKYTKNVQCRHSNSAGQCLTQESEISL